MRTSRSLPTSLLSSSLVAVLALALGACGGKGKPATTTTGGGSGGDQLPWEARLTPGARFELASDLEREDGEAPAPITVTVTAVERDGAARVYKLDWGEEGSNGPTSIRVDGTQVTIGEAAAADMQDPWEAEGGGATCYAEDYSNPDGCDDICDASLCISPTDGIVSVFGLYAPGYGIFSAR